MTWTPKVVDLPATDLGVIGAGSAGVVAAIAAARELGPDRVVLVERYGFLGGSSTGVLDTFYGFFTPGEAPKKVIGGIAAEVVDRLHQTGDAFLRPNTYGAGTGVTYNPERLKLIWDQMTEGAGVRVILHALLVDVEEREGQISAVILATKSGFFRLPLRRWIDASGDADLCHLAGIPYEKAGDIDPAQTLTTTFRMANVDLNRFKEWGGKKALMAKMAEVDYLPRKQGSAHAMTVDGCIATVAARVADVDATDVFQLGEAEREGRRQAFHYERFFRECVPGYERSAIIGLAVGIGVRETRRVYGDYRLTREDCLTKARFDDRVQLCGAPIEDHRAGKDGSEETAWAYVPEGGTYDVPYRCLVPKGRQDGWIAGRCFSATHDAHASCRSMAHTMSMGAAAGLAASLAIKGDLGAGEIPLGDLQELILAGNGVLEEPRQPANVDRWVPHHN